MDQQFSESILNKLKVSGDEFTEPEIERLEKKHPELVREVSNFNRLETMSVVGSLLTYQDFHANTIRIELLQHLIHRNANGSSIPTRNRIDHWLNKHLQGSWAQQMEDPVEDVFISNIVCGLGNCRIFEGIWEANDFWLQEALNSLRSLNKMTWASNLLDQCFNLLVLSEAIADRCQLPRYCMGSNSDRISLPNQIALRNRASLLRFPKKDLFQWGVSLSKLAPFIHGPEGASGRMGNSTLERRPLLETEDEIIVALPTAISPSIRLYIAEEAIRSGSIEKLEHILFSRQKNILFSDAIQPLDGSPCIDIELPELPENLSLLDQSLVKFDVNKYAHVVFFEDPLIEFLQSGLTGTLRFSDEDQETLARHCQKCAEQLASTPGYTGGLTIGAHGGIGRAFILMLSNLPDHWHMLGLHLHDFVSLGRAGDSSLLECWKILEQEDRLSNMDINLFNMNGFINLFAYFRHNGDRLMPLDTPTSRIIMTIASNFHAEIRRDLRNRHNYHAIQRRNPDVWVGVRRFNTRSYFKEVANDPIYADGRAASQGQLRGVIETNNRGWWLSVIRKESIGWKISIQYKIWEALLYWMGRIAPLSEKNFTNLPDGPIEIFLELKDFDQWTTQSFDDIPEEAELITIINNEFNFIRIVIPIGFLNHFAKPRNTAERKLIFACFSGISKLSKTSNPKLNLGSLVQEVVKSDEARFFHLAFAQTIRQRLPFDHFDSRTATNCDIHFATLGISQHLLKNSNIQAIEGSKDCSRFLNSAVDACWIQIRDLLKRLDRSSVIVRSFNNIEAIEREKHQWVMTASALLATHDNQKDVISAAHRYENERSGAALASRIIVEMAVCTCPESCEQQINESDFDQLLALIQILLYAANSSDALQYNLTPAKISISKNGEFHANDDYIENVVHPYMSEYFGVQFNAAAAAYDSYYQDPREPSMDPDKGGFPQEFETALISEYGIPPEQLISALSAIENESIKDSSIVNKKRRSDISKILRSSGINDGISQSLFEHFTLFPRKTWDERKPEGFKAQDWYPWRYRRRLSVVARPLIQISTDEDPFIIYSTGVLHDSVDLLFKRLMGGRLQAEDFKSSQMRSWIGEATRQRGDEFEEYVAQLLRDAGLNAFVGRPLTEFGADNSYGDLDVFAWNASGSNFFLIECKRLRFARTVGEIGEQLREFKGVEMDRLARHVRRCKWLENRHDSVRRVSKVTNPSIKLHPLLVTSTVVPMQFVTDLPLPARQIVPASRLVRWISAQTDG